MEPTDEKFEIDKFDGKGDLEKYKLLSQSENQGLAAILQEDCYNIRSIETRRSERG